MFAISIKTAGMILLITDIRDGISLYRGQGKGKFSEVTSQSSLPRHAKTVAFADLDGDGDEDLLLDNRVFRNEGGKTYQELMEGEHRLPLDSMYAGYSIVDYDRDGKLDIYAVGGFPSPAKLPPGGSEKAMQVAISSFAISGTGNLKTSPNKRGVEGQWKPHLCGCLVRCQRGQLARCDDGLLRNQ